MKILAISGSLRKGSFNTGLIDFAAGNPPKGIEIEVFDISSIPIFNGDGSNKNLPESVAEFKKRIESADGILISSPEYNRSIPGPLKNAIDYASIPFGDNSWEGKVVGIMGASSGGIATAVAHYDLKNVFMHLGAYPTLKEVLVGHAGDKIKNGILVDQKTKNHIQGLIEEIVKLANGLNG